MYVCVCVCLCVYVYIIYIHVCVCIYINLGRTIHPRARNSGLPSLVQILKSQGPSIFTT